MAEDPATYPTSTSQLSAFSGETSDNADGIGMDSDMVEKTVLRALGDAALESDGGDSRIAALIPLLKSAKGGLVVDQRGGKNADYAREVSLTVARQRAEKDRTEHERARQDREDRTLHVAGEAMTRLMGNPAADTRDLETAVRDLPDAVEEIQKARRIAQGAGQYDDPAVHSELFSGIWTGETSIGDILKSYNRHGGKGLTLQTANQLIGEVRQKMSMDRADASAARTARAAERQAATAERQAEADQRRAYRDLITDPLFTNERGNVRQQFADRGGIMSAVSGTSAAEAEAQLTKAWLIWQQTPEGDKASPADKTEWLRRQSDAIVTHLRAGLPGGNIQNRRSATGAPPAGAAPIAPKTPEGKPAATRVLTAADLMARADGRLTENAKAQLKAAGVPPDAQAIAAFFREQAALRQ